MEKETRVDDVRDREHSLCGNLVGVNRGTHYRIKYYLEISVVFGMILLAWGLFSLPVIFHHLDTPKTSSQQSNMEEENSMEGMNVTEDVECSSTYQFDSGDQRCHAELVKVLTESNCETGQIISVVKDGQDLASEIFLGLQFINAKESCLAEATPFLCLFAYGLCSSSGVYIQPTSSQCEKIRDSLCQTEWATAVGFGIALPNCDELPLSPVSCMDSSTNMANITKEDRNEKQEFPSRFLECSDGFYRENNSQICIPSCYSWHQYEKNLSILFDVAVCLITLLGIIASTATLILACVKPKRICQFPAILLLYMAISSLVLGLAAVIGYTDRSGLYCSSRSLLESMQHVTPYCVLAGILLTYVILQLSLWWLFHTLMFFWKVVFPFHSRKFGTPKRLKYIHAVCLIIGTLLPLSSVVATMADFGVQSRKRADNATSAVELFVSGGMGYNSGRFPAILCGISDDDVAFYSFFFPLDIIQAIGTTVLILLLWRVHRQVVENKKSNSRAVFKFRTAEKKLLVVYFYFEVLICLTLTTVTIQTRTNFISSIIQYFFCEQKGHDPGNPCSRSDINQQRLYILSLLVYVTIGLYPTVIFVYVLNIKDLIGFIKKISKCRK